MKKLIMALLLISILLLPLGCEDAKIVVKEFTEGITVISVGYSEEDSEDIFGNLSEEEIKDIIENITNRISEDDKYTIEKKDSIIEDVFKENGIEDEKKINAAKSKLTISK